MDSCLHRYRRSHSTCRSLLMLSGCAIALARMQDVMWERMDASLHLMRISFVGPAHGGLGVTVMIYR